MSNLCELAQPVGVAFAVDMALEEALQRPVTPCSVVEGIGRICTTQPIANRNCVYNPPCPDGGGCVQEQIGGSKC